MATLRLAWHNDSARLFSSDAKAAGQAWERASWLCPLPTPESWRKQIHAWGRSLRSVWPLWWMYPVKTRRGRFVLARGDKLVAAEIKIVVRLEEKGTPTVDGFPHSLRLRE